MNTINVIVGFDQGDVIAYHVCCLSILEKVSRPVAFPPLVVIIPFLTGIGSRVHAAMANRCFGVIPPQAMFGRS